MSFSHGSIVLGTGEGKTISVLGGSYTYKAAKEDTGSAYALIEGTVVGDGPPPHIHTTEEEAFYPSYQLRCVRAVALRLTNRRSCPHGSHD